MRQNPVLMSCQIAKSYEPNCCIVGKGFHEDWHRRRFSVRPGITCFWQVNGRSDINFKDWMKLDMKYIDEWSLFLDFQILMKTIPAVLKGSGAS